MKDVEKELRTIYDELCDEYNFHCKLEIVISKRLRSCNGRCFADIPFGVLLSAKIIMSKALLDEFGWIRFEKTFRHEVAHIANYILYGTVNHNRTFKILCQKFGGSMNRTMAGREFIDCAEKDFVKPIIKYEYHCPSCGYIKKMSKRMNKGKRFSSRYSCGECGTTLDRWIEKKVG